MVRLGIVHTRERLLKPCELACQKSTDSGPLGERYLLVTCQGSRPHKGATWSELGLRLANFGSLAPFIPVRVVAGHARWHGVRSGGAARARSATALLWWSLDAPPSCATSSKSKPVLTQVL